MCNVNVCPLSPDARVRYLAWSTKEILQGIINTTLMDHMWNQDRFIFLKTSNIHKSFKKDEVRMKYASCCEWTTRVLRNRIILFNILTVFTLHFLQLIEFSQRISPLHNTRQIPLYNNKLFRRKVFLFI